MFQDSALPIVPGMAPPGFHAPDALLQAMVEEGLMFIASARDLVTPILSAATTNMTGLRGVSLIYPQFVARDRLIQFTTNFQATSTIERAHQIIEAGGLLAVKAHIIKHCMGHTALDGIDDLYRNYLDLLFSGFHNRYGDSLWWTSMGEISHSILGRRHSEPARAVANV
jgi:hypothetical protein